MQHGSRKDEPHALALYLVDGWALVTSPTHVLGSAKGKGAQTIRGHRRRALILKVASELFAEFGYDSVTINDIGFAAGITGPGIYRYFSGKDAILVSIYEHLYARHREGLSTAALSGAAPREVLEDLVDFQIELATQEAEKIRIISSEERHLPKELAEQLRLETRGSLKIWSDLLRQERPELSAEEVEVTVHGVLALINSISLWRGVEQVSARIDRHLRRLAIGVLFGTDESGDRPARS